MSKCCAFAFHQTSVTVSNSAESLSLRAVVINSELEQYVNQNRLRGNRAVCILGSLEYQLLRVKRPDVPVSEMLSAILWQEQARFSLPVDQLVIDYIESPSLDNEKRIYVVAVAKRTLKERHQVLLDAQLQIAKITLPEFIYAHYVNKHYASESVIIWVNYFPDAAQVFAIYQGELLATLRLPKIESFVMSEICMTALNLFYLAEVKLVSNSPLWLMNGLVTIEDATLQQFIGRVQYLEVDPNSNYRKALEHYNHSTVSHAYYGMLANE